MTFTHWIENKIWGQGKYSRLPPGTHRLSVDAHLDLAALLGQPVLLDAEALARRSFHGHILVSERVGSNGGLARYRLVIVPFLAFLHQRIDSYVFQDMTVMEIVESVFADYAGNGKLAPAWRWDLKDPSVYRKRSVTTQYEESDLAFLERVLAEEGIFYWFEHTSDPASETLGSHTLVLADHNDAFADLGPIRYHRTDETEREDSIQQWTTKRKWQPQRLQRASWDYRSLDLRPVTAGAHDDTLTVEDIDTAGPYAWPDRATGERYARQHLEALQVTADTAHGRGSWRRQRPGTRFTLTQHAHYRDPASGQFHCVRVHHHARNNLGAQVWAEVEKLLGHDAPPPLELPAAFARGAASSPFPRAAAARGEGPWMDPASRREEGWDALASSRPPRAGGDPATAASSHTTDFYHNSFDALPAKVPYRPHTSDGHGLRLHPKPTVHGTQTAIVVSDGAPLSPKGTSCGAHTDRDHRIKVQFAWQRGSDSSTRLTHPSAAVHGETASASGEPGPAIHGQAPDRKASSARQSMRSSPAGDDNAPATASAWTWVRVAGPWAGDNWGSVLLPRQGQEVLVAFLEGDIDRPVVIGTVYNGRGQTDAAHNQSAAGATGNAPAWFDGNEHAAVFTGFKTQALADSQGGSGGYQQLRLDDTPGQGRAQASTTQHDSTLTLGHLKGGRDNLRGVDRGFGAELATQAGGALRAGAGLLLTTEPGNQQLSAAGAQQQLAQAEQLIASLNDAAKHQTAGLPDESGELPAQDALKTLQQTLQATQTGRAPGDGIGGGEGEAIGWSAPAIVASSPDGLVSVTPADQIWVSGTQTTLSADKDLHWLSQGETVITVAGGIALYTQGSPAPNGKPNQETGIALHAAQGSVSARAHANLARVAAQTSVTIASTQADVSIAASQHILATAAGAYLKLEGDNIELGAPGKVEFKASMKEWTGPKSTQSSLTLPSGTLKLKKSKRFWFSA